MGYFYHLNPPEHYYSYLGNYCCVGHICRAEARMVGWSLASVFSLAVA